MLGSHRARRRFLPSPGDPAPPTHGVLAATNRLGCGRQRGGATVRGPERFRHLLVHVPPSISAEPRLQRLDATYGGFQQVDEVAGPHPPDQVRVLVPRLEELDQRTGGGSIVGEHGPYRMVAHGGRLPAAPAVRPTGK